MRPLTIAHIADLHLSPEHRRVNIRNTKRLLDYVSRLRVDHLVVTGDITANAERKELELARSLFGAYGLLAPERMSIIPGNHDVYGGVHTAEDILTFPGRCRTTDHGERLEEFRHYFYEVFRGCLYGSKNGPFPFVKMIAGVVIVGINSVAGYSGIKNPLGSNGSVDEDQLKGLGRILSSDLFKEKVKIVLIHHHFSKVSFRNDSALKNVWGAIEQETMKLRGKKRLIKFFGKHDVGLILHGHHHVNVEYTMRGMRFLNGGGSILGTDGSSLQVNLLRISDRGIETEIHRLPSETSLQLPAPWVPSTRGLSVHEAA